jgi:hypothetical protein
MRTEIGGNEDAWRFALIAQKKRLALRRFSRVLLDAIGRTQSSSKCSTRTITAGLIANDEKVKIVVLIVEILIPQISGVFAI